MSKGPFTTTVELHQPIVVDGYKELYLLVGTGMDSVTIFGNGTIVVNSNGGSSSFTINIREVLNSLKGAVTTHG